MKSSPTIRLNANIDQHLYHELQMALMQQHQTVTQFIENSILNYLVQIRYEQDKSAFDSLSEEPCTQDFMAVEQECLHDGLS